MQADRRLVVREQEGSLWVELEGTPGRLVPAPDDCQARARVVAVLVASWLSELSAPRLRLPTLPAPGWGIAVEVSAGAGWNGEWAGMGRLCARLLPFRRLSFELGAHAQSVRGLNLSSGRAEYWRVGGVVGAAQTFRISDRWAARVTLAVLPGMFSVRGLGFKTNYRSQAFDLGLGAGVQLGVFLDPLEVWLGPFGLAWPTVQQLRDRTQTLGVAPTLEVGIGACVIWGERFWRKRAWGSW